MDAELNSRIKQRYLEMFGKEAEKYLLLCLMHDHDTIGKLVEAAYLLGRDDALHEYLFNMIKDATFVESQH